MPTILLIDDDIAALSALTTALEEANYTVERVTSADQARHFLDETDPDLIVLEVDTDGGAGWPLLRDIVRFEGPPTIVVSHRSREEDIVEALKIGAVDFLPKPFRTNELLARIKARLEPLREAVAPPARERPIAPVPVVEEPVFMAHADEHALFEAAETIVDGDAVDENLPIGARLHAARQRRRLTLVQINLETKIPIWYLQAMEEEKFSLLPRGPAGTEMIRSYAEYLGLNHDRLIGDYHAQHDAQPFRPIMSLGTPAPREIPLWVSVTVGALLALVIGIGAIWYFARPDLGALGGNLRTLVVQPTPTVTPTPTVPPTITPRPSRTPTP